MKHVTRWAAAVMPAALASLGCQLAHAQSSVTLYGVVDESVRYLTNVNKAGDSSIGLGPGGLTQSRWGLKGVEDLGGGWSTFFKLENRFNINSGQSDPTLPFFNEAQVGVRSNAYGQVILGRQYNVMIEGVTVGGYGSNWWIPYDFSFQPEVTMTGGIWTSNQVQYQAKYNGFSFATGYAFGGNAGNSYGSQIGAAAAYATGGRSVQRRRRVRRVEGFSQRRSGESVDLRRFVHVEPARAFRRATSSIRTTPAFRISPTDRSPQPALAALKYTDFARRRMIMGGITQQVGNTWHFAANVWRTLQDGKTAAQDGSAWQYQLVADYNVSRRTDVYLEGDYAQYRGGLIGAQLQGVNGVGLAQKGTQLGLMAGLRHQF